MQCYAFLPIKVYLIEEKRDLNTMYDMKPQNCTFVVHKNKKHILNIPFIIKILVISSFPYVIRSAYERITSNKNHG